MSNAGKCFLCAYLPCFILLKHALFGVFVAKSVFNDCEVTVRCVWYYWRTWIVLRQDRLLLEHTLLFLLSVFLSWCRAVPTSSGVLMSTWRIQWIQVDILSCSLPRTCRIRVCGVCVCVCVCLWLVCICNLCARYFEINFLSATDTVLLGWIKSVDYYNVFTPAIKTPS